MAKPHFTHIALRVRSLEDAIRFYSTYAGLQVIHRRHDPDDPNGISGIAWLSETLAQPRFVIVMLESAHGDNEEPAPVDHLGFAVPTRTEVDAVAQRAAADGCLAMPPRDLGPVAGYLCMLRDPDGNHVEFSAGQAIDPEHFTRPVDHGVDEQGSATAAAK